MAGTPGACSQVFCHPIRCMLMRSYRQRHVRCNHRPYHNHHNHHTSRFPQVFPTALCVTCKKISSVVDMPDVDHAGTGAARRRRERRHRAYLRYARMSVAMVLAEAYAPLCSKETEDCQGPRMRWSTRRYGGLRALSTPPPGTRAGTSARGRRGRRDGPWLR